MSNHQIHYAYQPVTPSHPWLDHNQVAYTYRFGEFRANIRRDGTCSCSEFKRTGKCFHLDHLRAAGFVPVQQGGE